MEAHSVHEVRVALLEVSPHFKSIFTSGDKERYNGERKANQLNIVLSFGPAPIF